MAQEDCDHEDMPNPADEPVEAAEPTQCSRYAFLCFVILAELIVGAASVVLWMFCVDLHPTTFVGQAFHVIVGIVSMIGLLIVAPIEELLVICFIGEALLGNTEGNRTIELFV